jgi:hypothetical protein
LSRGQKKNWSKSRCSNTLPRLELRQFVTSPPNRPFAGYELASVQSLRKTTINHARQLAKRPWRRRNFATTGTTWPSGKRRGDATPPRAASEEGVVNKKNGRTTDGRAFCRCPPRGPVMLGRDFVIHDCRRRRRSVSCASQKNGFRPLHLPNAPGSHAGDNFTMRRIEQRSVTSRADLGAHRETVVPLAQNTAAHAGEPAVHRCALAAPPASRGIPSIAHGVDALPSTRYRVVVRINSSTARIVGNCRHLSSNFFGPTFCGRANHLHKSHLVVPREDSCLARRAARSRRPQDARGTTLPTTIGVA